MTTPIREMCPTCLGQKEATAEHAASIRNHFATVAAIAFWQGAVTAMIIGALALAEDWPLLATVLVSIGALLGTAVFLGGAVAIAIRAHQIYKAADRG